MSEMKAMIVGKWSVGYDHRNGFSVLHLQWQAQDPVTLAIPKDEAIAIARAILAQYEVMPPKRADLS